MQSETLTEWESAAKESQSNSPRVVEISIVTLLERAASDTAHSQRRFLRLDDDIDQDLEENHHQDVAVEIDLTERSMLWWLKIFRPGSVGPILKTFSENAERWPTQMHTTEWDKTGEKFVSKKKKKWKKQSKNSTEKKLTEENSPSEKMTVGVDHVPDLDPGLVPGVGVPEEENDRTREVPKEKDRPVQGTNDPDPDQKENPNEKDHDPDQRHVKVKKWKSLQITIPTPPIPIPIIEWIANEMTTTKTSQLVKFYSS